MHQPVKDILEHIFPELKESEDDRIRKQLIAVVELYYGKTDEQEKRDCLSWLEKQGEQKPAETEKGAKGNERKIPNSAWSEDDEQYLLVCKNALAKYQTTDKWDACIISHWLENKLKSPQTAWKPSEEQIIALEVVIDCYGHDTETSKIVTSLLEQLKAL